MITRRALFLALAALVAGCTEPPTFVPVDELGGPRGAITGSMTYSGPGPCTRAGRVVGAAVLLAFEERALPPPDGLGTEPLGLAVIPGDDLFAGIPLEFAADGAARCPAADAPPVTVSAPFAIAPLEGGVYQIRGFFDRDGDFNPAFSLFNLPTRGDVGGGAVENAAQVLAGARPRYRAIALGELDASGARRIPPTGALVDGVAVSLGLTLPFERPMFHVAKGSATGDEPLKALALPSDYELPDFDPTDPAGAEASLVRLGLAAGFPESEQAAAKSKPFSLPINDATFAVTREDVDRDGQRDGDDHIPESALIPSLAPLALMTKLDASGALQTRPAVLMQGLTILDSLAETAFTKPDLLAQVAELTVALRPAAICLDPRSPTKPAVLLQTRELDGTGRPVLKDPAAVIAALAKRLGRPVDLAYGCLPQGRYAMNLVYETGQAWTLPNEAGVCAPGEEPSADGTRCGGRPRLASQGVALTIGPPRDPAYCASHPTPEACLP